MFNVKVTPVMQGSGPMPQPTFYSFQAFKETVRDMKVLSVKHETFQTEQAWGLEVTVDYGEFQASYYSTNLAHSVRHTEKERVKILTELLSPPQETTPYDIRWLEDIDFFVTLPTRWGEKLVVLTDDPAYDCGGYIILEHEGNTYHVPGFVDEKGVFHDDASYTQLLPIELTYQATR